MLIGNIDNFVCVIHCYLCLCNWIEFRCLLWSLLEIVLYGKLVHEFMHVGRDQNHNYTYLTQTNSLKFDHSHISNW